MTDFLYYASDLRNLYWRIRAARNVNKRRTWYRKAAKEKGRLVALGYHPEVVRLYALHLRDTTREARLQRFEDAFREYANPLVP